MNIRFFHCHSYHLNVSHQPSVHHQEHFSTHCLVSGANSSSPTLILRLSVCPRLNLCPRLRVCHHHQCMSRCDDGIVRSFYCVCACVRLCAKCVSQGTPCSCDYLLCEVCLTTSVVQEKAVFIQCVPENMYEVFRLLFA